MPHIDGIAIGTANRIDRPLVQPRGWEMWWHQTILESSVVAPVVATNLEGVCCCGACSSDGRPVEEERGRRAAGLRRRRWNLDQQGTPWQTCSTPAEETSNVCAKDKGNRQERTRVSLAIVLWLETRRHCTQQPSWLVVVDWLLVSFSLLVLLRDPLHKHLYRFYVAQEGNH